LVPLRRAIIKLPGTGSRNNEKITTINGILG
jgi:hypothetical protein